MTGYQTLVAVHGIAGTIALATYWVAALARKGSPLHRGAGKVFFLAMIGIVVTAALMVPAFVERGMHGIAVFLAYLVVLVVGGLWLGWFAIRRKQDQAAFRGRAYRFLTVAILACSAVVLGVGLSMDHALLIGFSSVGFLSGGQALWRWLRPMDARNWWLQEHYGAMVGLGAATHIAFLGIGLNRLVEAAGWAMPPQFQLVGWFAPVAVAVVAGIVLDRRYKPKPVKPSLRTAPAR